MIGKDDKQSFIGPIYICVFTIWSDIIEMA